MVLLEDIEQICYNAPLIVYEWSKEEGDYVIIYDENETIFENANFSITKEMIEEHAQKFYKFMQENKDREVFEIVPIMDDKCKLSLGVFLDI